MYQPLYFKLANKIVKAFNLRLSDINGKKVGNQLQGNSIIRQLLRTNDPFLVSRYGTTEARFLLDVKRNGEQKEITNYIWNLWKLSGVYPPDWNTAIQFFNAYSSVIPKIDVLGVRSSPEEFISWRLEEELIHEFPGPQRFIDIEALSPFNLDNPWTHELEGKKVLIVHPFVKTMSKQYQRRKELFTHPDFLPEFNPIWLRAPQTLGKEQDLKHGNSWMDSFTSVASEIDTLDFDVALIGCGAYGLPLGGVIKDSGRQALHIGGVLQVFFGVKWNRWRIEAALKLSDSVYKNWVWPSKEETPENATEVENSVYWKPAD